MKKWELDAQRIDDAQAKKIENLTWLMGRIKTASTGGDRAGDVSGISEGTLIHDALLEQDMDPQTTRMLVRELVESKYHDQEAPVREVAVFSRRYVFRPANV